MLSRVLTKHTLPLQDGTALQVFVAEVAKQIVGIAVIRKEMVSYEVAIHCDCGLLDCDFLYYE